MEKDCLFCKIVNKKIESEFLYENENIVVIKDINPQAPVHLLIIPKKHIRSINDITDDDRNIIAEMLMVAKEMAKQQGVDKSGYNLLFNVEKGGGQVIFHLHLHILAKKE